MYETSYGKFGQILYYILLKSIPVGLNILHFQCSGFIYYCSLSVAWWDGEKSQSRMFGSFFSAEK